MHVLSSKEEKGSDEWFKTLTITNKVLKGIYHIAQPNSHRLNVGQAHGSSIGLMMQPKVPFSNFFFHLSKDWNLRGTVMDHDSCQLVPIIRQCRRRGRWGRWCKLDPVIKAVSVSGRFFTIIDALKERVFTYTVVVVAANCKSIAVDRWTLNSRADHFAVAESFICSWAAERARVAAASNLTPELELSSKVTSWQP